MIDISVFSESSSSHRIAASPWIRDEWRYATDGKIVVRQPARGEANSELDPVTTKSALILVGAFGDFPVGPWIEWGFPNRPGFSQRGPAAISGFLDCRLRRWIPGLKYHAICLVRIGALAFIGDESLQGLVMPLDTGAKSC